MGIKFVPFLSFTPSLPPSSFLQILTEHILKPRGRTRSCRYKDEISSEPWKSLYLLLLWNYKCIPSPRFYAYNLFPNLDHFCYKMIALGFLLKLHSKSITKQRSCILPQLKGRAQVINTLRLGKGGPFCKIREELS